MFRGLIALVLAFAIAMVGIAKPVYAYSDNSLTVSPIIVDSRGDNNSININSSSGYGTGDIANPANSFVGGVINGIITTAGIAIGGAIACYAIDGVATIIFPPAAAAAALCPAVGTATGGAGVVVQAVH